MSSLGVAESSGYGFERGSVRRIPTQREDVLDAGAGHIVEDRSQLGASRPDACDVGDDRETDLLLNLLGESDRAGSGRAAGAIGNRHERGSQRLERFDRLEQPARTFVVFGRKELERKEWTLGRKRVAYAHVD